MVFNILQQQKRKEKKIKITSLQYKKNENEKNYFEFAQLVSYLPSAIK